MKLSFEYLELNNTISEINEHDGPSRLHNTSIVHLRGNKYLLLCRYTVIISFIIKKENIDTKDNKFIINGKSISIEGSEIHTGEKTRAYKATKIVPGNDIECKNLDINSWTLFWWNNWNQRDTDARSLIMRDDSVFIIWDAEKNTFDALDGRGLPKSDIRLGRYYNYIVAYDDKISHIYLINEDATVRKTIDLNIAEFRFDKNLQIISMDKNTIDIFNWFTDKGIKLNKIYCHNNLFDHTLTYETIANAIISECYISYTDKQHPILGTGSCLIDKNEDKAKKNYGIMPLFSFTTPHIALKDGRLMGVGHIKIHTNQTKYPFKPDSNIDLFRKHLTEDMKQYESRYIPHNGSSNKSDCEGYIYLMFFYIYDMHKSNFIISDAFCPLDLSAEYYFSLIFPMGIALSADNKTIYVTAGIGDYYAVILTFSYDEVVTSCTHSMLNLDLSTYHYYLAIVGKPVQYVKRLADYRQQGGRDYHKLYQKYKQKYLRAKKGSLMNNYF